MDTLLRAFRPFILGLKLGFRFATVPTHAVANLIAAAWKASRTTPQPAPKEWWYP